MQSSSLLAVALSGFFISCILLLGCEQPEAEVPLRIVQISFTNTVVLPGESISIAVTVEGSDSVAYQWQADAGEFSAPTAGSTDWTAPGLEQLVAITLAVTADDGRATSFSTDLVVGTGIDHDGDGFSLREGDCDDTNSSIYPGAPDTADGLDNDCDGLLDEGSPDADDDADGFTDLEGDCNDGDTGIYPGADELLNGIDDNCDGRIDEGTSAFDDDGDGYSEDEGDCNDQSSGVGPDAPETLDGLDNNCSGEIDEGTAAFDDDGDGFSELGGDCNDDLSAGGATVFPGSAEILDGVDNDCDGLLDEDFLADSDGDGWSLLAGDCDDTDFYTYPGAPEFFDGVDNDCNGQVDDNSDDVDNDGDGYSESGGDCDDTSAAVYPGAVEIEDVGLELDNDCNGYYFQNAPSAVASVVGGESSASTCSTVVLDGSLSFDPDGDALTYYWFFDAQPINSALTSAEIRDGDSAVAKVNADVPGLWVIGLLVSDGLVNSAPFLVSLQVTGSSQIATSNDADCDGVVTADDCNDNDTDLLAIADDGDCDTIFTAEDCNDANPGLLAIANDADCDGVVTAADCDDNNVSQPNLDADCDGIETSTDCDDNDPTQPSLDADCDGVVTADDCDDTVATGAAFGAIADDADCDGVPTDGLDGVSGNADDDCNDNDTSQPNLDADCDGVLTAEDCDDTVAAGAAFGAIADDADCDGVPTDGLDGVSGNADDDCNDNDISQPNLDADCDGVLTADDCDDTVATGVALGAIADDADCDGVLADGLDGVADGVSGNADDDDCDDNDPSLLSIADDADCDGARTDGLDGVADGVSGNADDDDCDDNDPSLLSIADDADCDGVLTDGLDGVSGNADDDCNDNDISQPTLDVDCDGVLTAADCDDTVATGAAFGAIADDADCDGVLTDGLDGVSGNADDDCNDNDISQPNLDADCDGALTDGLDGVPGNADDDCNDNDPIQPSGDADCDGVLSAADCDDADPALLASANDVDCDGTVTANDCDDNDNTIQDSGTGESAACPATSCLEIVTNEYDIGDQLYWIDPDGQGAFEAWCDMSAGTGGWTAFYVGTSGSQFAVFDLGELDNCSQPASECLRRPPSSLASNAELGIRCGSTMLSFPMSTALVDYFISGTQANWQSLGPPNVEEGSYGGNITLAAEFFTGDTVLGALGLGWVVSMDAAGAGGIFAGSSPSNAFCNGAADTSSAVYLFYR